MIILGIDPGLNICGYACIDTDDDGRLIEAGTIRTDSSLALEKRLDQIAVDVKAVLEKLTPGIVAVEQLYSHYAHPKTAILMGHARGVIMQACAGVDIDVKSFSATRIKKSLTGNGRASKSQMQKTIQTVLALPELPEPPDVADAIGVAMCCANELRTMVNI